MPNQSRRSVRAHVRWNGTEELHPYVYSKFRYDCLLVSLWLWMMMQLICCATQISKKTCRGQVLLHLAKTSPDEYSLHRCCPGFSFLVFVLYRWCFRVGTVRTEFAVRVQPRPPKANSAFHPSGVGKWVPASAGKAKAGMVYSVSGWTRGVQVKLWDPLRTRAIPERLRGVFTTRRYTNQRLPYLCLTLQQSFLL